MKSNTTKRTRENGICLRPDSFAPASRDFVAEFEEYLEDMKSAQKVAQDAGKTLKRERHINALFFPRNFKRAVSVFADLVTPRAWINVAACFLIKTGCALALLSDQLTPIREAEQACQKAGMHDECAWFESFGAWRVGDDGKGAAREDFYLFPEEAKGVDALASLIHFKLRESAALGIAFVLWQVPAIDGDTQRAAYAEADRWVVEVQRRAPKAQEYHALARARLAAQEPAPFRGATVDRLLRRGRTRR